MISRDGQHAPRRPLRRTLFAVLAAGLALALVETFSFVALSLVEGHPAAWGTLRAHRRAVAALGSEPDIEGPGAVAAADEIPDWALELRGRHVIHPYLGFVELGNPEWTRGFHPFDASAASFGFPRNFHPLLDGAPANRVVVVVLGGSVAQQIAGNGRPVTFLEQALGAVPRFRDRSIWILNLALGGYKQPQQLLTLTYFLSLGMKPDVVINLDGFNEVALPVREDIDLGIYPFYPRAWKFQLGNADHAELRVRGAIALLEELRRHVAGMADHPPASYSITAGLLWTLVDGCLKGWSAQQEAGLLSLGPGERNLETQGPEFSFGSLDETYAALVAEWRRGSLQLHRLATSNGFEYYHFLQPNQYDEGSKKLTFEERRQAWDPDSPLREGAARGYPLLRRDGESLRQAGVRFVDLSRMFETSEESVYLDTCCHFNTPGVKQVVARIVATIETSPGLHAESAPPAATAPDSEGHDPLPPGS